MLLVIGSTGTLGQALRHLAQKRHLEMIGVARKNAEFKLDVSDDSAIRKLVISQRPRLVINCAAITDLDACETNPLLARQINAKAPGVIAEAAKDIGARFVHISTDHFFTDDGNAKHKEDAPVSLVNEYARTKFLGEVATLNVPGTLSVRTNFTGWRGWSRPTFVEWAVGELDRRAQISGFFDFYTSTIDAGALAEAILDLAEKHAEGIYNVASSEVTDKMTFLSKMANALGAPEFCITKSTVRALSTRRAESLGLCVSKAEAVLGRRLPGLDDVIGALIESRPGCNA